MLSRMTRSVSGACDSLRWLGTRLTVPRRVPPADPVDSDAAPGAGIYGFRLIDPEDLVFETGAKLPAPEILTASRTRTEEPPAVEAPAAPARTVEAPAEAAVEAPAQDKAVSSERETPERRAIVCSRGEEFFMFETPADARAFDYDTHEESNRLVRFLNALYIPQGLRGPGELLDLPRTKAGNRANAVTLGWDRAEAGHAIHRLRSWIVVRRRDAEEKALTFRNAVALATMFVLLVCCGLALQKATRKDKDAPTSRGYSVASTRSPEKRAPVTRPPVIERDETGQVVSVSASDPRSVLLGFCKVMTTGMCEPVELAWSDPPHPQVRYGVFRSFYDMRAIEIRRDPRTNQWSAGDGRGPIADFLTQVRSMSTHRIPVETGS